MNAKINVYIEKRQNLPLCKIRVNNLRKNKLNDIDTPKESATTPQLLTIKFTLSFSRDLKTKAPKMAGIAKKNE